MVYAAQSAYYDLLLSQHLVQIAEEDVRSAQAHLQTVEKRRAGGVVSDFDVLRAQVELSNYEANLLRARNAINISRANLIKILGISQESDFVLSDEFVFTPMQISMDDAVEAAFKNRPDLYSQEIQIRQQREQLRIARSRYLPTLNGYFTNTWAKPDPKSSPAPRSSGRHVAGVFSGRLADLRRGPAGRRDHPGEGSPAAGGAGPGGHRRDRAVRADPGFAQRGERR